MTFRLSLGKRAPLNSGSVGLGLTASLLADSNLSSQNSIWLCNSPPWMWLDSFVAFMSKMLHNLCCGGLRFGLIIVFQKNNVVMIVNFTPKIKIEMIVNCTPKIDIVIIANCILKIKIVMIAYCIPKLNIFIITNCIKRLSLYCKFCKNLIIKSAIYSLLLHLKLLHVHSLKKRCNKVTL